jgi:hypothetical protein
LVLGSTHADNIIGEHLQRYRLQEISAVQVCSSQLDSSERALLDSWAIPYSKFPTGRTPHPVLKALENHRNVNTLPHLLSGRVNVVSMKMSKVRALRARCPNADIRVYNPVITPADVTRFSEPADLAPHIEADILVFDDCLHHLSPGLVSAYMELFNCERVLASGIFPIETLDHLSSVLPQLYSIQYLPGDKYLFSPRDNESASYEQHIGDSSWWNLGSYVCGDSNFDVEFLSSHGPYHFVSILRNVTEPVRRTHRAYDVPDVIRLPTFSGEPHLESPWFPASMFVQAISHAGSLRKLGDADVIARIRGLANTSLGKHIPLATWERLAMCCTLAGSRVKSDSIIHVTGTFYERLHLMLRNWLLTVLPTWLHELAFSHYHQVERVRNALNRDRVHFTVPLKHDVVIAVEHVELQPFVAPAPVDDALPPDFNDRNPPRPPADPVRLRNRIAPDYEARARQGPRPVGRPVPAPALQIPGLPPAFAALTLLGIPPLARHSPEFGWVPTQGIVPQVPETCGHLALREITAHLPHVDLDDVFTRVLPLLPALELERASDITVGTSVIFLHAVALLAEFAIHVHYHLPMPNGSLTRLGLVDADVVHIHAVRLPTGEFHWQGGAPPRADDNGPMPVLGDFVGAATDLAASFFAQIKGNHNSFTFAPNYTNAKMLFTELDEGTTGMASKLDKWPRNRKKFESAVRNPNPLRQVECVYFGGVAGSGKSYDVRQVLLQRQRELSWFLLLVCPLSELCFSWVNQLRNPTNDQKSCFKTHERAFFSSPSILILDEAQKFPGHYLDYYVATHPDLRFVIMLGDPFQCGAPIINRSSQLRSIDSPGITLSPFMTRYLTGSWRINSHVASCWNIPIYHSQPANVSMVGQVPAHLPVIVTTVTAQNVYAEYGTKAFTMSSCGGQDFPCSYTIVLTRELLNAVPPEAIYTCFTRSRSEIFVYNAMEPGQLIRAMNGSPLLASVLQGVVLTAPFEAYMGTRLNQQVALVNPIPITPGARLLTVAEVLQSRVEDPITKFDALAPVMRCSMLAPPPDRCDSDTAPVSVRHAELVDSWVPTYCGRYPDPKNDLLNGGFPREDFEFMSPDGQMGEMFDDVAESPSDRIENLTDIFPLHRSSDPALFRPSVEKRLRFASAEENEAELSGRSFLGPLLSDAFLKDLGLVESFIDFDSELFDHCVDDCARKRLSKSTTSLNNLERDQDPSIRTNYDVLNFLKGQLINKLDALTKYDEASNSVFPKIKPAQMITTYTEEINAFFGPLTRYLAAKLRLVCPEKHVMFYGGMSLSDLDEWSREHVPPGLTTSFANDYTAYDKSCRGESLAFEICIMRYFSIPEEYIDLHCDLTLHLNSALGHLGIMRTSGQWCTYLFNSWFNAAYFALKYEYPASVPRGFSGDDMFILCVPVERSSWARLSPYFSLVGKPVFQRFPEFCGWILTCHGIIRHPYLILLKTIYHQRHGTLPKVLINYFLEHSFTYRLGDAIHDCLPPDLVSAHGECSRIFLSHARDIPEFLFSKNRVTHDEICPVELPTQLTKRVYSMDWRHVPGSIRSRLLGL